MNLTELTSPINRINITTQGRSVIPFDGAADRPLQTDRSPAPIEDSSRSALRLGHVHVKVRDLSRSVPFYTGILGLRLREWSGRYAFLALGDEHHSVALEEIGDWASTPARKAVGIAHIAFQAPSREAFMAMRGRLAVRRVPSISRDNGISWAVRFRDPDRNEIEIYVDRRYSSGGAQLWNGHWHGSLRRDNQPPAAIAAAS